MTAPKWTEAHRKEALRRTYELAAELAAKGLAERAKWLCVSAAEFAETEYAWRHNLSGPDTGGGLGAARVHAEVRRVRALAEGRLVRETVWRAISDDGEEKVYRERAQAVTWLGVGGGAVVRVARIRRRSS